MAIPLESLGAKFGTALGQSLPGVLNQVTEHKVRRIEKNRKDAQRNELVKSGMSPALADLLLSNPKLAEQVIPGLAQGGFFDQEGASQEAQQQTQQQTAPLEQLLGNSQRVQQQAQQPNLSTLDYLNLLNSSGMGNQMPAPMNQDQSQAIAPQQKLVMGPKSEQKSEQSRKLSVSEALNAKSSTKQKADQAREERESKKVEQKEQHHIDKETKPYFDQVLSAEKAAHDTDRRAGRLDKIVKEGGLPIAFFYDLFKKLENASVSEGAKAGAALGGGAGALLGITGGPVGAGAGALAGGTAGAGIGAGIGAVAGTLGSVFRALQKQTSPSLEEFEKLSSDFIKGAKAIFGARITDKDLEYFFNTIPTLSQTDSGKKKILRNIKTLTEASHLEYKTMKDIIKENNGKRPENLALLVNERMQPELDKLSQKFISGD